MIGFALAHAEQAPLYHLEAVRFHIRQNKQQPNLRLIFPPILDVFFYRYLVVNM